MKSVEEDIEFYIPHAGLDLQEYLKINPDSLTPGKERRLLKQAIHHLSRYEWAARVLQSVSATVVLDVACGAGYGSQILSESNPSSKIYGGDYDPRAITHATAAYGISENKQYINFDLETWRSKNLGEIPSFDVIISFDTLEHLNHPEIFLINCVEAMPQEGMLLLSTPCGHEQIRLSPEWDQHKIEYSAPYLKNLLKRFFGEIIDPSHPEFFCKDFWEETVNKHRVNYLNRFNPLICRAPIKHGL